MSNCPTNLSKKLEWYQIGWNIDQQDNIVCLFHDCTARLAWHSLTHHPRFSCTANGRCAVKNLGTALLALVTHCQSGSAEWDSQCGPPHRVADASRIWQVRDRD
jgi:hypothetical protein